MSDSLTPFGAGPRIWGSPAPRARRTASVLFRSDQSGAGMGLALMNLPPFQRTNSMCEDATTYPV